MIIKRVGILRGGSDDQYYASLKNGGDLISHISGNLADKYRVSDILVDRDYVWHLGGLPISPSDLMNKIDVIWNVSHPSLSNIVKSFSIPHIYSSVFYSNSEHSKEMLKKHIEVLDVAMPRNVVLPVYQKDFDGPREQYAVKKAREIFEKFSSPWIVKSFTLDANMSVHLAKTFPELIHAIKDCVKHEKSVLVEEFISGKSVSIHSLTGFRGQSVYIFPLGSKFKDFLHYEKERLFDLVKNLREHLGAKHYLKADLVLHPRGKIYLIDISTMPDLEKGSHFRGACEIAGIRPQHVIGHILQSVSS